MCLEQNLGMFYGRHGRTQTLAEMEMKCDFLFFLFNYSMMQNYVPPYGLKGLTVQTTGAQSQETWILAPKSKGLNWYMNSM